jgi:thiol-disulfide isomerase/thioredoxin
MTTRKISTTLIFGAILLAQVLCFQSAARAQTTKIQDLKPLLPTAEKKQPVLINFWATWCPPCHDEFPDLVKIDADYRAKGLNFDLVSVDNERLIETKVPEFLNNYKATMPSYLINLSNRKEIAKVVRQIAPKFSDAYPLTLLFDADGKLVFQKIGRVNPKLLRAAIDKVLVVKVVKKGK